MASQHGELYLSVITPINATALEIRKARAWALRNNFASTGLWSIETGRTFDKLHLNLITPRPEKSAVAACVTHIERITTSARAAAAYITKRSAAPSREQYDGRLLGAWGQIGEYMTKQEAPPIIQGACINDLLSATNSRWYDKREHDGTLYKLGVSEQRQKFMAMSAEEQNAIYKDAARRHMPALYELLESGRKKPR
jgi:hypothetical protein